MRATAAWGALILAGAAGAFALLRLGPRPTGLVAASALTIAVVNLGLDAHVYPRLLEYQSTGKAGEWLHERGVRPGALYAFRTGARALDFYARRVAVGTSDVERLRRDAGRGDLWVYTDREGLEEIRRAGIPASVERWYRHFRVSKITPSFLDPATRARTLQDRFLLRLRAPSGDREPDDPRRADGERQDSFRHRPSEPPPGPPARCGWVAGTR